MAVSARQLWCAAFVAAAVLYVATASRDVQWQDGGWQQYRIVMGQIENEAGLALVHPVQHYLGRLAVWALPLKPQFAITLVSALAGAVAIANIAAALMVLSRRLGPSVVGAAALMLSHTLWQHSTHTESYAIVAAALTGEILCLSCYGMTRNGRYLIGLAFLNGLGIANHLLASIVTPVDVVLVLLAIRNRSLSRRGGALAAAAWLLGTTPYSVLVLTTLAQTQDVVGTLQSALFGRYASAVLNVSIRIRTLVLSTGYVVYNFPGLALPLAVYGLVARLHAPTVVRRALTCELILYAMFVSRYAIVDQYTFFFPVYVLLAVFAGLGLARLLDRLPRRKQALALALAGITVAWTPLVYMTACSVLRSRGAIASLVGNKPYRDGYRAFLIPWGAGERYGTRLNDAAREAAGADGLILVADGMIYFGVRFAQAVGELPETVSVIQVPQTASAQDMATWHALLARCLDEGRPIVLIPRDRDDPQTCLKGAEWLRRGDLYVLAGLEPVETPTSEPMAPVSGPT
ncbi:MAG: DUF2723 domain-containing protein [Phycisphaerae bacterium]|nr:DUF2723 domain-containing protein [Phycisphaerae bacterium]